MATGTVQFQSATLASPPAALAVMADAVNHGSLGAGSAQYIKIMNGAVGGTAGVEATEANGLEVDVTRVQGTVQALGTVQGHGTFQVLGTFQSHGTNQALGTYQPLAGSVHLAAGSVNAQGVVAHGAAAAGNPVLIGGFGSSGTQTAVSDGNLVRFALDLNGRVWANIQTFAGTIGGGTVQTHGTSQVIGTVQTHGTSQVLGTMQGHGTFQVLGTVQTHGTSQVIGTFQSHGTNQALGTYQPLAGSVHPAAALPGTSQISGTVRTLAVTGGLGESFFGTMFTAGVTNGTLVPAPSAGTYVRVFDIIVSGSAAGTAFLEFGDGTAFGPAILAANGGYVFNSSRGVRTRGTALDILFNAASGSWGVTVNYVLEN